VLGIVHHRAVDALRRSIRHDARRASDEGIEERFELAYFGGFSQSEIATMLEMPIGTVKGRIRLGLDKLRGQLGHVVEVSA
jgi:RNA polymerase sigma-70 factor (ECF subfamily)